MRVGMAKKIKLNSVSVAVDLRMWTIERRCSGSVGSVITRLIISNLFIKFFFAVIFISRKREKK